ncbi:MAG: T9SS type A sorting domain-containing protein [Bacteroidales bacterium]|nr:T9SS type A sorting domain-containing protein [Bacteroidales bacterium]
MNRPITFVFIILLSLAGTRVQAQGTYQLPNPGFEDWSGNNTSEPEHWNSFASSDGTYASLANTPHHYRRSGHRPGGNGNYYLTIYTKSIIGVKANGNMTTGRIHAGSMSAGSSDNYNYTQRSNSNHCQPFTGTPDSMYVWVSYYAASGNSKAQVTAIIHGDSDFRSPNDENNTSKYKGIAKSEFERTTSSASSMQWQQLRIPFEYSGTSAAEYILINLATNNTPGGGSANDSLSIDDIEFIYSAWLTNITAEPVALEGFEKGQLDYYIQVEDTAAFADVRVGYSVESNDASVEKVTTRVNDSTLLCTLTVTAEDGVTQKIYTITFTTSIPAPPVGIAQADGTTALRIYPNPANDRVTVECALPTDKNSWLTISDMTGRTLQRLPWQGQCEIDLSGYPAGCYLLQLGGQHQRLIKK